MSKIIYYIIDTSSLIELNFRYPIDIFPGLWENVEKLISRGKLNSPEEVRKEILVKDDTLRKWVSKQKNLFKPLTAEQIVIAREIINKYQSLAKSESETPAADPFVIALAVELGRPKQNGKLVQKELIPTMRIIVTEERLRGNRIRIPFVCQSYNINCINILEMCRQEGWKF